MRRLVAGPIAILHYDERIKPGAAMAQALVQADSVVQSVLDGAMR
ncbi:hypothetical protein [Magnetospirillum moscoviense]|nr:hypothetical protein [Magnetospirillum moscoviense]